MVAYGNLITILENFIILTSIIFMMTKQFNRLKKNAPPKSVARVDLIEDMLLLRAIRDSLKK